MDTLRNTYNRIFKRKSKEGDAELGTKEVLELMNQKQMASLPQQKEEEAKNAYNIDEEGAISYQVELLNFIDHNAPQGFAAKFQTLLPFIGLSLISWPSFWVYRSFKWHNVRRSERITVYINRTFQQAKAMQLAILTMGLLAATVPRLSSKSLEMHQVIFEKEAKPADD